MNTGVVTSRPLLPLHQLEPPIIPPQLPDYLCFPKFPTWSRHSFPKGVYHTCWGQTQQVLFITEPKNLGGKTQEIQHILWLSFPKRAIKTGGEEPTPLLGRFWPTRASCHFSKHTNLRWEEQLLNYDLKSEWFPLLGSHWGSPIAHLRALLHKSSSSQDLLYANEQPWLLCSLRQD